MSESTHEPDGRAQGSRGTSFSRADLEAAIDRLEQALEYEGDHPTDHARCRTAMPEMAAAELEGRRVAKLFPFEYAHLDACEECALEYADLIDTLLALEDGSLTTTEPPPPLPGRLLTAMRVRGWVERTTQQAADHAQAVTGSIDQLLDLLLEHLRNLPAAPALLVTQQEVMAFGGEDDATSLLLASWYTAQQVAEQYSVAELQGLVEAGTLARRVQTIAEETAGELRLPRSLRRIFVDQVVRSLEADPAAFVQMGKPTT